VKEGRFVKDVFRPGADAASWVAQHLS